MSLPNRPQLPAQRRLSLPAYGDADGAVLPHAGRYARECVLVAFEMIGGVERLADWARKNPTEFYTRLYGKVVTREMEVHASEGIEDLLSRLDAAERSGGGGVDGVDFETVEAETIDEE